MSQKLEDLWPGQTERIDFDIDQVRCLSSVARSEIFWAVSITRPMSIADVATALDRPTNTTTYHVNELVKAGLLLCVGERKAKKRIEKLYVKAARSFFYLDANAPKEYRNLYVEGFQSLMRAMGREMETLNEVFDFEPNLADFRMVRRYSFKIAPERAKEFKQVLSLALREFSVNEDAEGVRVNTVLYMAPTLAESRRRLRKRNKS